MAYKRPRTMRPRRIRRVKRRLMKRVPRGVNMGIVSVKRTFRFENWSPSTTTTNDFWKYYQPSLANLPSVNEFTGLFDQYRINGIKISLRPRYSGFDGANSTDTTLPGVTNQGQVHCHYVIDKSTGTIFPSGTYTSSNLNTFLEAGGVRSIQANRTVNIYIRKPCVLGTIQGVSARAVPSPWLGTNETNLAHRGVHIFMADVNLTGTFGQQFDVFFTYYMQFKGMK